MPRIETEIDINAPLDVVWKVAQDVENLPHILPDLEKCRVLERQELTPVTTRTVTDWIGRIKQFNRQMRWTEEDIWNSENYTCHFWQLRGDFTDYKGEYHFVADGARTQVRLVIDYRFEIPLIGKMMQKVILKLMQDNCDATLKGLKSQSERIAKL